MSKSHASMKRNLDQLCSYVEENYDEDSYVGVLLCEGDDNSLDAKLYGAVYPYLLVIPTGGFADIKKLLPCLKNRIDYPAYGLIDRDGISKKEIQELQKNKQVYCTKLPFLENIICTPEMMKIGARYLEADYRQALKRVRENAMSSLSRKIKDTLPLNISVSQDDVVESIQVVIVKDDGCIMEKTVSSANVLYTYRDKTIASYVAEAFGLHGRQDYYAFISRMLEDSSTCNDVVNVARSYLPMIGEE